MTNGVSSARHSPIEVKDLRKAFGDHRVLDGITLRVRKGETLALLGRSGTGKSVLLKLIVGLQQPDGGSVSIGGETINGLSTAALNEIRKKVGYVFQQAALYDSLSVEQNVAFPVSRHTSLGESELRDKARELLTDVGMRTDDFEKMPSEISGGMQKRVGLARALALDPDILLLDEPTAGLDPITAGGIGDLINGLKAKRGITSLVVTHDVRGARGFADRLILIDKGKIVALGTFDELRKGGNEFVEQFLGDGKMSAQAGRSVARDSEMSAQAGRSVARDKEKTR